jgi:hypothetical protein
MFSVMLSNPFTSSSIKFAAGPFIPGRDQGRGWRRLVAALLTLAVVLTGGYAAVSIYIGTQIQVEKQLPIYATPASLGLQYKDVTFPSREDQVSLHWWSLSPSCWHFCCPSIRLHDPGWECIKVEEAQKRDCQCFLHLVVRYMAANESIEFTDEMPS